jgi:hypothetical protein
MAPRFGATAGLELGDCGINDLKGVEAGIFPQHRVAQCAQKIPWSGAGGEIGGDQLSDFFDLLLYVHAF